MTTSTPANVAVAAVAVLLSLVACSSEPATTPTAPSSTSGHNQPLAASTKRPTEVNALTADAVIRALTRAGLAVPHPMDTTAQECGIARCEESIVTDTVRVKSFDSAAQAAEYAIPRGLNHIATLVVSFPPPMPQGERQRYWSVITRLVP